MPQTGTRVPDIARAKTDLRIRARQTRRTAAATAPPETVLALTENIFRLVEGYFPQPEVVAAYWPMGGEIDPLPALAGLAEAGWRCALPVVTDPADPLQFRAWLPGDPLQPGRFHTCEPLASAPPVCPVLLLIPMLAFDRTGHRLGQGAGCYDRTLAALRRAGRGRRHLAVGLAYAAQEVPEIPRDDHDAGLDAVVSERYILRFGNDPPKDPSCA